MLRFPVYRSCPGYGGYRVYELRGAVGGAARLAVIAVLVGGFAAGAGTLDKTVCQEQLFFRVEGLDDVARGDVAVALEPAVDLLTPLPVFIGVGAVKVGKIDKKA